MKRLLSSITLLIVSLSAYSQWSWVNPELGGHPLNDICFVNDNVGFIVGSRGTILKTTNGGVSWNVIPKTNYNDFYNAWFCSSNVGYVSSDTGTMFKTTDGGINWSEIETGTSEYITDLCFISTDTGFFTTYDGKLFKTTDSGVTWQRKINKSWGLSAVEFANKKRGIVTCLGGTFYKTEDGGETWEEHNAPDIMRLWDVSYTDPKHWFISGWDGLMITTSDGGDSWNMFYSDRLIGDIQFVDSLTGYALSSSEYLLIEGKSLYKTIDGGHTWQNLSIDHFSCLHVNADNKVILPGWYGILLSTDNDCLSFTDHNPSATYDDLIKIQFPSADTGYAISYRNTIVKTTDAGENWHALPVLDSNISYHGIWFTDNSTGYVTGNQSLYKTTDGGLSWNLIFSNPDSYLTHVVFTDNYQGFVVSDWDGKLYRTTDAGITWNVVYQHDIYLRAIQFIDNLTGFIALDQSLLKTTDGGLNWIELPLEDSAQMMNLHFVNGEVGYMCGNTYMSNRPTIYKTIDGGLTWSKHLIKETYESGVSIYFIDEERGFLGCDISFFQTKDGGETWEKMDYMQGSFESFWFTSKTTGYVAGSGGMIMKTTNAGTLSIIEHTKPASQFTLFPNPATDEITITSNTTIGPLQVGIYNSSGSCVFDESLEGKTIKINASSLKAGLYLVRINTLKGTEVKKLVLL